MLRFEPLTSWPWTRTPHHARKRSPYTLGVTKIQRLLLDECTKNRLTNVHVLLDAESYCFRRDGLLYADARLNTPAVLVTCEHPRQGPLRIGTDLYQFWSDNMHAIGRTLKALRISQRDGCMRDAEQFAGFRALPGAGSHDAPEQDRVVMNASVAARNLATLLGLPIADVRIAANSVAGVRNMRARAARMFHPDLPGGQPDKMSDANGLCDLLEAAARA
jgi:hypothetical protein